MPRVPEKLKALNKKWNMYVSEVEKAEFSLALMKSTGYAGRQSAAVRAFMYLYANDEVVRDRVNEILEDYVVYKDNGEPSLL